MLSFYHGIFFINASQKRARRTPVVRLALVRISSLLLHHIAADVISFAATFLQKSSLTHSVAASFQAATAGAGLRFGFSNAHVHFCQHFPKPLSVVFQLTAVFPYCRGRLTMLWKRISNRIPFYQYPTAR